MPLIREEQHEIIVDISDTVIGGKTFKRHVSAIISIEPWASLISMYMRVYCLDDNKERVPEDEILYKQKQFPASMALLVDADPASQTFTVPIVPASQEYIKNENDETILNPLLENRPYMYEFELFRKMLKQPVIIEDLVIGKVGYADMTGFFDN